MQRNNKVMKDFTSMLDTRFGTIKASAIMEEAWQVYERLLNENLNEPKALKAHTVEKIYPTISIYRALQKNGVPKEDAEKIIDEGCSERAETEAQSIRTLLKFPGLYKAMPSIYRWMTVHNFGEDAGFKTNFYETDKKRCKFDMVRCPYFETCTRCGCPEITKAFCHTDNITSGTMHPRIHFNRTKTIGEGGDCCDFEIVVED